jgi:hypothetical protein
MVPLVLPGKFVVVQRSPGVERPLSSMRLVQVVRVVLVGCDNCMKLDIICPSTEVRTTRC